MTPQAKRYYREFKLQTVRLMEESDKPMRVIAEELGISVNTLSLWRKAVRESGQMSPVDYERAYWSGKLEAAA